jgi:Bacterial protein of unknown function (DUF839)
VDSTRWSVEDEDGRTVNPTDNPTFASVLSRRALLQGAAAGMVVVTAGGLRGARGAAAQPATGFASVAASSEDKVIVPPGYRSTVVLRWGDPLFPGAPEFDPTAQTAAKQERQFGYDNDFIGFMPLPMGSDSSTRGLLGVNHENARSELFWPGWDGKHESKTRAMVETEIAAHGFTVVEIARAADGSWSIVKGSPYNRRITGATPMAIRGPAAGSPLVRTKADPAGTQALGTLNNCAGGFTPWGTFLTGEENIQNYFRGKLDVVPDAGLQAIHKRYGIGTDRGRYMTWGRDHERFDLAREPNEPNRFGWVVEIDPYDPGSMPIKHTALGRMAHEGDGDRRPGRAPGHLHGRRRPLRVPLQVRGGRPDRRGEPPGESAAPRQRDPLRRPLPRRRERGVAAARARPGTAHRGERLPLPGRDRGQHPAGRRPARRHQDGPARGRRAELEDRQGLRGDDRQREPRPTRWTGSTRGPA